MKNDDLPKTQRLQFGQKALGRFFLNPINLKGDRRLFRAYPRKALLYGVFLPLGGLFFFLLSFSVSAIEIDIDKIIQIESSGNPYAVSSAGCRGVCQISEITLREWNNFHPCRKYSIEQLFDRDINIRIATWYLHVRIPRMLKYYKKEVNVTNVLWAYNAGIGRVVKGFMPKETRNYINKYKGGE